MQVAAWHRHVGRKGTALASVSALMTLGFDDCGGSEQPCDPACDTGEVCEGGTCVPAVMELRLFFTDDEHGFVTETMSNDGSTIQGGAANMMSLLRADGHEPGGDGTLLLSVGDTWDGAPLSWNSDGVPMMKIMNLMGYAAAALGNHDLVKGPGALEERLEHAEFPFLAANLRSAGAGSPPSFAAPYIIRRVNGVNVGVVGLTVRELAEYPHTWRFDGLEIDQSYATPMANAARMALADGAALLIGLVHVCHDELRNLARHAANLGFVALAGGHCHGQRYERVAGIEVFTAGALLGSYARLDIMYDRSSGHVTTSVVMVENVRAASEPAPDEPGIEAVIEEYGALLDERMAEPVGFTSAGIAQGWAWRNTVADGWLAVAADADVAIGDWDSIPGSIPPGSFDRGRVYEAMPYHNEVLVVTLTGAEIIENVTCCGPVALAGVTAHWRDGAWEVALVDGTPVQPSAEYQVVTHEWWIAREAVLPWHEKVAAATWLGVDWREPVVDRLVTLGSSPSSPIDDHIDPVPRISGSLALAAREPMGPASTVAMTR